MSSAPTFTTKHPLSSSITNSVSWFLLLDEREQKESAASVEKREDKFVTDNHSANRAVRLSVTA